MRLGGRRALVTGATGGLGAAVARALAARGAHVVVTGRRADVLEPLAAALRGDAVTADLADPADVKRLAGAIGDVDVLVANAALPASGRLESFSVDELDRALAVNLRAPMVLAHAVLPAMVERGEGHLVFVNSLSGRAAAGGGAVYSATKFGLRGFALALREDLLPHGVGVSSVFPGFVREAGMFADSGATLPRGVGTNTPDEVAAAVVEVIERNRAERYVAPLALRLGTLFAALAPGPAFAVGRRLGSNRVAEQMAQGQADKR